MSLDLGEDFVMKAEFLQPWSTFVMKTVLPPIVLEKMIKITDDVIVNEKNKGNVDWERSGSGQMNDEFSVEPSILERENIIGFFLDHDHFS